MPRSSAAARHCYKARSGPPATNRTYAPCQQRRTLKFKVCNEVPPPLASYIECGSHTPDVKASRMANRNSTIPCGDACHNSPCCALGTAEAAQTLSGGRTHQGTRQTPVRNQLVCGKQARAERLRSRSSSHSYSRPTNQIIGRCAAFLTAKCDANSRLICNGRQ